MPTLPRTRVILLAIALLGAYGVRAHESQTSTRHPNAQASKVQRAFGVAGEKRDVTRTIEIHMLDEMRFTPQRVDVRRGETVRFVVTNTGKLMHELVIGTKAELDKHAAMMMGAGMAHDESYIAHVQPGKTGELVWKFNLTGRFDFACLVPGHYEAGMVGTINVAPR